MMWYIGDRQKIEEICKKNNCSKQVDSTNKNLNSRIERIKEILKEIRETEVKTARELGSKVSLSTDSRYQKILEI